MALALEAQPRLGVGYRQRVDVRLMVADRGSGAITHARFSQLTSFLEAGDVLVINVSATVPAAMDAEFVGEAFVGEASDAEGFDLGAVRLHFSSPVAGNLWTVEPRRPLGVGSGPWLDFHGGVLRLGDGATVRLLTRTRGSRRLWLADTVELCGVDDYLQRHGIPIRYAHEDVKRPLSDYQTIYAAEPGSAEMPSAGRPFSAELITALAAKGVVFAPLVLHTGVASFEAGETPDAERYSVPEATARSVNLAAASGGRVVAVGTSSARAIETVTDSSGVVHPGSGVTELLIGGPRGMRVIDSIVSGWHDDGSSHLELLAAISGRELLERSYFEARSDGYLAHEFGDSLLVLGNRGPAIAKPSTRT